VENIGEQSALKMSPNNKGYLKKIATLVVIFTAISYVFLSKNEAVEIRAINVNDCSIMQNICDVKIDELSSLSVDVLPRGLPPTQEATIVVRLNNIQANKIEVLFTGVESGYSPPKIHLNKATDEVFNGKVFLSLCSAQKIKWIANLKVYTDANIWKITLPFVHSGDGYNLINPSYSTNK
jgi:hypothetical protein